LFFNSFGSISVALPAIQRQFGNSLAEIQWVTLMGVVTISSLSFCFGRVGTRFGQRRLYKMGVLLYGLGAGIGAISTSLAELLFARGVMAVGLAMALPMSTAILAASFAPHKRGQALGLFASAIAVGRMTGPTMGGFLLQAGGWPWIFWMNFIVGIVVTLGVVLIFRGPGEQRYEPFDGWGAAALLLGYPLLLVGFTFGESFGWISVRVVVSFLGAFAALSGFVWIELHTAHPLIDVRMLKGRVLAGALLTIVLSHLIYHPIALCAPLYLQNGLGASAASAGLVLAVLPLSTALASPVSGRFADRFDASRVACAGLVVIVAGVALYAMLGLNSDMLEVAAVLALLGAGIGFFTPANQKLAFASVGQRDYGVISAMLSSFGTAAGTIGITISVALMEASGGARLWSDPAVLASAQRFAFSCLLPIGIVAIVIGLRSGKVQEQPA
jgi:EmrB/QacA subfamily drug resistance transporter